MRSKTLVLAHTLVVLAVLLSFSTSAGATEVTWSYSGQITYTDFPAEFPLGAPVRLSVTVDPGLQLVISATATFNGFSYEMAGPTFLVYLGPFLDFHIYASSGFASGPTVGSFTPWFSTLFFRDESGPPLTADPLTWAQSFVFEDFFGAAIGASDLTPDPPPTPEELLLELCVQVNALDAGAGIATSLCAKLGAAMAALEDNSAENDVAARNALAAFVSGVEAQSGKELSEADATLLVTEAERIMVALGG